MPFSRRQFLKTTATSAGLLVADQLVPRAQSIAESDSSAPVLQLGLVTYLWGKDLTVPELLEACVASDVLGVELRTTHAHGVEPSIDRNKRRELRQRFKDSPVSLVGLGSNERFDSPDTSVVRKAIETSKRFLDLSKDVGSGGVKVKGDRFYDNVEREQTLSQVIDALGELGDYARELNQQVRLEVHGGFRRIPIHHEIISRVNHPNVRTCWNSNEADLEGDGLTANFRSLRPFFGGTAHVRQFDHENYPWRDLIKLFKDTRYRGWILLEAHGAVPKSEVVVRLKEQKQAFDELVAAAQ